MGGIQVIALLAMAAIIFPLVPTYNPLGSLGIAFLLLLLPVSQGAVELMNHTISAILKPRALPKLDFSEGIPDDCKTLVAVPTLLLNEHQVAIWSKNWRSAAWRIRIATFTTPC